RGCLIYATDINIAIEINTFEVPQEPIAGIQRPISDLSVEALTADVVADEIPGLLPSHAIFEAPVPIALVIVEIQSPQADGILKAAVDVIPVEQTGDAAFQSDGRPPEAKSPAKHFVAGDDVERVGHVLK